MDPKRSTPRHIIIKSPKFKDKKRILKAARERVTYKGVPIKDYQLISQKKYGTGKNNTKGSKARTYNQDYSAQETIT